MSFSYDETLATALDRVRSALGDTSETTPVRSDEHIGNQLVLAGTTAGETVVNVTAENVAVATIAFSLASDYRNGITSFSESGGISVNWGDRADRWYKLALDIMSGRFLPIGGTLGGSSWMAPVDLNMDIYEPMLVVN